MIPCTCEEGTGYLGPCHGAEPDITVCAHCEIDVNESDCIETAHGFLACSTMCGLALEGYGHREACERPECADGAVLTLPVQLCAYCDGLTPDGARAHAECRSHAMNALTMQASAGTFAAFGREGAA